MFGSGQPRFLRQRANDPHRKIKPTGTERVVWGEASREYLVSFQTHIGKLGGLICWENYMPMARMSMYKGGVEIYLAPTADSRKEWTSTMKQLPWKEDASSWDATSISLKQCTRKNTNRWCSLNRKIYAPVVA